jgi:hypothetical protein
VSDPRLTREEQPWVQTLRSEAGLLHLGVNDQRACELRGQGDVDPTPTAAELPEGVPPDTPTEQLCAVCFELGRGG